MNIWLALDSVQNQNKMGCTKKKKWGAGRIWATSCATKKSFKSK